VHREISPLDGRYRDRLTPLGDYFSEFALVKARCEVELRYLEALDETGLFPPLSKAERARIRGAHSSFDDADFLRVKEIEKEIRHDVKACELFLRERLALEQPNRIHFALTSADVNNLAYGLILSRYRDQVQLPQVRSLLEKLIGLAEAWKEIPFPARTHGQPASPTTAGKEIAVFAGRLLRQAEQLQAHRFRGKLNGATGTYGAFVAAYPDFDWVGFSESFVRGLGLEPNPCTTQIDDGDNLAEYFAIASRIHGIVFDLDLDLWEYVSRGEIVLRAKAGEVGSSTMPHKVNPIRFENSEGNLAIANALLHTFSERLTRSRMQRDLSDTTVRRNIGVALAHGHLAIGETIRGLEEIDIDAEAARSRIDEAPEVLAEAIQTILRAEGVEDPFELLKDWTRGTSPTLEDLQRFVDTLPISEETRAKLEELHPSDYTGLAVRICGATIDRVRDWL
jgi:adenylosuccinate lyase